MTDKAEIVVANQAQIVPAGEEVIAQHEGDQMIAMIERIVMTPEIPIDRLEKMLELRAKEEDRLAKQEYYKAMANFRKRVPVLPKDKTVRFKNSDGSFTEYHHTSLGKMMEICNPILGECGLDVDWDNVQEDGRIICTATVTHELGYSKSTSLSGGPDTSGKKNTIQQTVSATTYLKRSTMGSLLGLASEDDDDGRGADKPVETINEKQQAAINDMIGEYGADKALFLKWAKVAKISEINAGAYNSVIAMLKKKGEQP